MPNIHRTKPARGVRSPRGRVLRAALVAALAVAPFWRPDTSAGHEGHDHDKPPPLNLPVAPRVVAVTPDYELVGVLSGEHRLTIFLHRFETGEPVKDAKVTVSAGEHEVEATRKDDGVFDASVPWIGVAEPMDIVFRLTLPKDEDILTGRIEKTNATTAPLAPAVTASPPQQTISVAVGALITGALLTLLIGVSLSRRPKARHGAEGAD